MDKAPDAFRTISEVAEDLDLPQHVLRFWETRFNQIRPMKRGGGRRYYRPDDVELLRGIRHLLYGEGYTIKGVQRILKEHGVRFVMETWRNPGMPIPNGKGGGRVAEVEHDYAVEEEGQWDDDVPLPGDDADDGEGGARVPRPGAVPVVDEPLPTGILPEGAPVRTGLRFIDRLRGTDGGAHNGLTKDDIRRLQSTLFELLECKRLLDQTR